MTNTIQHKSSIKRALAIAALITTSIASMADDDFQMNGWVMRSIRELEELKAEQAREDAILAESQAKLDASRRELAAIEMNQFVNWVLNGEQGFCPVQFDMSLPNPCFNTPAMQSFFAEHPEAVKPCNPVNMMIIPTPESARTMLQMAQSFQGGAGFTPAAPFVPMPPAPCVPVPPQPLPTFMPAPAPMFLPMSVPAPMPRPIFFP